MNLLQKQFIKHVVSNLCLQTIYSFIIGPLFVSKYFDKFLLQLFLFKGEKQNTWRCIYVEAFNVRQTQDMLYCYRQSCHAFCCYLCSISMKMPLNLDLKSQPGRLSFNSSNYKLTCPSAINQLWDDRIKCHQLAMSFTICYCNLYQTRTDTAAFIFILILIFSWHICPHL